MSKEKNDGKKMIALFNEQPVRRVWNKEEEKWYFSVVDVVAVLTESSNPTDYLKKLRKRDLEIGSYLGTNCPQVEMISSTGKKRKTLAGNTEQILRIVQSIPSPKAEPFKRWLAKVGYERIQEIEDPELAMDRVKAIYEKKGYPKDWIDKRMRGIAVRHSLTDEWRGRGLKKGSEYAILTNEIMESTFGLKVDDYKKLKGLERENLRDHMEDMELILTMLGEATTTKLTQVRDSKGFVPLKKDANDGGSVAGRTRKDIEKQSDTKVVSPNNFLGRKNYRLK